MRASGSQYGMQGHIRRIHMVGAGGAGMSGIAEVLVNLGYRVSGSDLQRSETTDRLASLGVVFTAEPGHRPEAIEGADVVVASTAVQADNPEILAARDARIPVIRRAEMLAELMRLKTGIAVAGAHGKTTTTSMLGALLEAGELDPTVVVGGKLNARGSHARPGRGPLMVVEADESDGSFLLLSPSIAIVTGLDQEHLDHYRGGMEEIRSAFLQFLHRLPFYGLAVVHWDEAEPRSLVSSLARRVATYGLSEGADYRAVDIESIQSTTRFTVVGPDGRLGDFEMPMIGRHNVENALAALVVADELGVSAASMQRGLSSFQGVDRRFSIRGEVGGVLVVDDYGHHPSELAATIEAARTAFPSRRLHIVFQPHRYSRTGALLEDFGRVLALADLVTLTEIYPAGEQPLPGVNASAVRKAVLRHQTSEQVFLTPTVEEALASAQESAKHGDLVLACGAGSIGGFGRQLVERLGRNLLDGS